MQAQLTSSLESCPPSGGAISVNGTVPAAAGPSKGNRHAEGGVVTNPTTSTPDHGIAGFQRLQRRLLFATLVATALAVPLCLWLFDLGTAASLLVGGLAGLLYLRLLARSVSRLGVASKSLSKAQLLVPIALVLAAAKIPALQMLPALIGFLLYKPALIAQALLDA